MPAHACYMQQLAMMGRPACQKDPTVPMMVAPKCEIKIKAQSPSQSSCLLLLQGLLLGLVLVLGRLCRHRVYGINMLIAKVPGSLIDVATHVVHYSNTF